eukprot:COSAG06_NODE_1008_length_11088_cov_13.941396_2_plen_40_part_00
MSSAALLDHAAQAGASRPGLTHDLTEPGADWADHGQGAE